MLQFIVIYFISCSREIYLSNLLQFYLSYYPGGNDNPSFTLGCKYLFFMCRYRLCSVAWFSYWFDNLSLITEGNIYRSCAASSIPLWGNTNIVQAASLCISMDRSCVSIDIFCFPCNIPQQWHPSQVYA